MKDIRHCEGGEGRYCEFGVVGAEQADESHFDANRKCVFVTSDNFEEEENNSGEDNYDDDDEMKEAGGLIKFSKYKLYGRDEELNTLHAIFNCLCFDVFCAADHQEQHQSQGIFLSGYSGSGKSALAREFSKQLREQTFPHLFLTGKYDEMQASDSYSGISKAFGRWLSQITNEEDLSQLGMLQEQLEQEMGVNDAQVLCQIIPTLGKHFIGDSFSRASTEQQLERQQINKSRITSVFLCFMKHFCTKRRPVILFLDDLQWADDESLELVTAMLSDPSVKYLMFLGSFRFNEVHEDHPLTTTIQLLKKRRGNDQIEIIELNELSKDNVGSFIGDTLQMQPSEVEPLTEVIHTKSLGNVFFTMQALEHLVRQKALYYDVVTFSWEWNLGKEQLKELLEDDIIQMVQSKIEHLPEIIQKTLILASYTRSTFDVDTLCQIMDGEGYAMSQRDLFKILDKAVFEGLLVHNVAGSDEYSFFHDRIQEAASGFVVGNDRDQLMMRIGRTLVKRGQSDTNGEDWMLFTAAHYLNTTSRTQHLDAKEKIELAKLNLQTAQLSMSIAAFRNASHYATNGINLLPKKGRWERHRNLSYALYSIGAEANRLVGNFKRMEEYSKQNLAALSDRPTEEKIDVYYNLSTGLYHGSARHAEAIDMLLDCLSSLGCKFPFRSLAVGTMSLKDIVLLKSNKKKRTSKEVDQMKIMDNPKMNSCMRLLNLLFDLFYVTKDDRLALVICRALEYTLEYGLSIYSPRLVAAAGLLLVAGLTDFQGGSLYANYALKLMKKLKYRPIESGAISLAYYTLQWTMPLQDVASSFLQGYKIGMESGDFESAAWCITFFVWHSFQMGKSLEALNRLSHGYIAEMKGNQRLLPACFAKMAYLVALNLAGTNVNSSNDLLVTRSITEGRHLKLDMGEDGSTRKIGLELYDELLAAFERVNFTYFGEYILAAESALEHGEKLQKLSPGGPINHIDPPIKALSCFAAARMTGKQKYTRKAMSLRTKVKSWVKSCNPNAKHLEVLLDAEYTALKTGKTYHESTVKYYESAVHLAEAGMFVNHAALANERWGEFALEVLEDKNMATSRLRESMKLYRKWGALAKVKMMEKKHKDLLFPSYSTQRYHSSMYVTQVGYGTESEQAPKDSHLKANQALSSYF